MAIITIPTSIGGVSIPGAAIAGPLGALFGNKYGLESYQYPRNLGSATKGHIIKFSINQTQPAQYTEGKNMSFGDILGSIKENFNATLETPKKRITAHLKPQISHST